MEREFSHLDAKGNIRMKDIGNKKITNRFARAQCVIKMKASTLKAITRADIKKGDVFTTAKIAGIQAAKRVDELIPLCHSLSLNHIEISFHPQNEEGVLSIVSEVGVSARTGAEMEALQAVTQAALTVYDMCKAVDRSMVITDISLLEKRGGKSGTWEKK